MLSDKQFGMTHSLLATKVMPSLITHTVNPALNIEQVLLSLSPKLRLLYNCIHNELILLSITFIVGKFHLFHLWLNVVNKNLAVSVC